ncbi:hypothetical protein ACQJBY_020373 [Aegilops geniculata]
MAEFVLGLTKTAVEGTLIRVKSAIEEEAELKGRVQNDLVFITGEFEMMHSFLYATNASERAKNPVAGTWVRQLRDLAFDVEDCVDFVITLDTNKPWAWLWRVVPSCMAPPRPLDKAVAEIKQLKARVEHVSTRNARYNLIGDDSVPSNQLIPVTNTAASSSEFDVLSNVWEAAGKLRGTGDLKKLITGSEGADLQVISLWHGSCSTGAAAAHRHHHHHVEATYIMKKAYDDPEIVQGFKRRAWIKLVHPFDTDEFLKTLLAQFYPPCSSNHQSKQSGLGGADFRKKMRAAVAEEDDFIKAQLMHQVSDEGSYLVVLEGVSAMVEWDAIRMYLPDSNNASRIVVFTEHLRIALLCTREPYQVSQLTRFSDGQFLCAFSNKGSMRRSDVGEFNWQIRRGGVISVVGISPSNHASIGILPKLYQCIMRKRKGLDGVVVFEKHSWVDIPEHFDMEAFSLRLFLNFQSRDFKAKEIQEVGKKGDQAVIEGCRKVLQEHDCLIVINGLKAQEYWDKVRKAFLSMPAAKCKKTSVIVITEDEAVANYCVRNEQNRVFNNFALQNDEVLNRLMTQDSGITRGMEDSILYDRADEAFYWANLKLDGREKELSTLSKLLKNPNPGVISVFGRSGVGKSTLVKKIHYEQVSKTYYLTFTSGFSWIDVPNPFDITEFSWRMLLDFNSANYMIKEDVATGLMKGEDAIQACRKFMDGKELSIVIDGLQSNKDWDIIRENFLSEPPTERRCYIIVIANKKSVAKHCVDDDEDRLLKVKHLVKDPGFFVGPGKEMFNDANYLLRPGVISFWGIAGVGKSTLVRNICDNMDTVCQKKHKMSWVDVPHPFHLIEFSFRLLLGFYSQDLHAQESAAVGIMEGKDTVQACRNFLCQDKCLVVIDGLGSIHDWDLIKSAFLSETTPNSSIILITTEEMIATHCVSDKRRVHNIKGLEAEDALHLFTKVVGGSQQLDSEMDLVKHIVTKCGGLPRVIVSVGECLAEEISWIKAGLSGRTLTAILGDINDDFMGRLETDPRFHDLKSLFSWMRSYFDACSDSLKPCIFYLSVFESDKKIRRRRLLRRWIAEGYSRDTSGGGTAEENGEELFIELVKSSIIQLQHTPSSNKKIDNDVCLVNGFFHDYIISRPIEDNLVFALEGCCSLNSQRAGQHLTIRSCWDRDQIVFKSIDFSRLRSLTVFGEWSSFFISKDRNMGLLRVLDLEDTKSGLTDDVLEQIGELLPRLKFLSVRGCKDITRLPHSLDRLRQLQTLDIRHTKIAILPHAIIKLVKLQDVRAGTTHKTLDGGGNARLPSLGEDDCTSTSSEESSSTMEDGDCTVGACMATTRVDSDSLMRSQTPSPASASADETSGWELAIRDADCISITQHAGADAECAGTSHLGTVGHDGASASSQTCVDNTSQAQEGAENGDDISRRQHPSHDEQVLTTRSPWRRKARSALLSYSRCWSSKKKLCACCVEAPAAAIEKLATLHTFGVVNVSGARGNAVLKELKKLTQLRKLGVCGINRENWHEFFCDISGHGHLESLSVHLDEDADGASLFSSTEGMFSKLPKTLKGLKLYTKDGQGNVQVRAEQLGNLSNVTKGNLTLTVSTQDEIHSLSNFANHGMFRQVCVEPAQDGTLYYGSGASGYHQESFNGPPVLKINCGSYKLKIVFIYGLRDPVEVLVLHCSNTESSLELSDLVYLRSLKEVTLKGPFSEEVKEHLRQEVEELRRMDRVVRLD